MASSTEAISLSVILAAVSRARSILATAFSLLVFGSSTIVSDANVGLVAGACHAAVAVAIGAIATCAIVSVLVQVLDLSYNRY